MPWFFGNIRGDVFPYGLIFLILWSLLWKGLSLWHAARRNNKWWFIGILVLNTLGIVEICYLTFVVHLFSSNTPAVKKSMKKKRP